VEPGGSVTGVYISRLDLGDLSDEFSFNQTLREPLKRLYEGGFNEPIVLLIDALDEALTYTGNINIVQLLAKLTDLPAAVRFLVTTRPDRRVLKHYSKVKPFDLIDDAPSEYDDVRTYGYERLADLPEEHRSRLAERISRAAQGNFLYAGLVIADLSGSLPEMPDLESLRLPKGLAGIYHDFLNRELGADEDRWFETFKPVLGLVAVAQGEGLSRAQIERIIGKDVDRVLRICRQYLEGQTPDGPFRPFHKSFADYLLEDKENHDYHIDAAGMHRQIADYYWDTYSDDWRNFKEDYGLNNLAVHLYESGKDERLQALISEAWMRARYAGSGYTYNGFLDDVNLAWQTELAKEAYDVVTLVRFQTARQAITQQVSIYTDIDLKTLVWLGRKQEALAHARLRTEAAERVRGLVSIYEALRERGQADIDLLNEAEEVVSAIPYGQPRAEALRELAAAMAQTREGRASEVFAHAEEAACAITDDRRRAETLREVAAALARAGHFAQAEKTARAITYHEYRAKALGELAAALAQAGERRASEVFAQAEETARAITLEKHRAETFGELAAALARAGRFAQAEETARAITYDEYRAEAFGELAAALARAGRFAQAEETARAITGYLYRVKALSKLAAALTQAGGRRASEVFAQAEEIARAITIYLYSDKALSELAAALTRAGRFAQAEKTARAITYGEYRVEALRDLAAALARAGEGRAREVFARAEETARAITDDKYREKALSELAVALVRAGHFAQAEKTARAITHDEYRAEALGELAAALARAGHFSQAEETARAITYYWIRPKALRELAAALAEAGESRAREVFAQAEEVARAIKDDSSRAKALSELAAALARAGHFSQAEETARAITDHEYRAEALGELAAAQARADHFAQAEETARAIRYYWIRAKALSELAAALARAGEGRAREVFARAEETARAITSDEYRAKALSELAAALAEAGESRAREVFAQAEETARAITYDEYRAVALSELAAALSRAGHFAQAEEAARAITSDVCRGEALSELAAALAEAGESRAREVFAQAEETARAITANVFRAMALRELAAELAHVGQFDRALTTLGSRSLTEHLQALTSWASVFERQKPGLSVAVLREATGVAGWVSSHWRKIHELLSAPERGI
jgi:hypothetical protein